VPVRDRDIERQGGKAVRGKHRYNVRVPMCAPFVDEKIFEHPSLVGLLADILGDDYIFTHYDSNIPLKGTDFQNFHRDGTPGLPGKYFSPLMLPCSCVGVKFPLVNTSEANGSFELLPGTQNVVDDVLPKNYGGGASSVSSRSMDEVLVAGLEDGAYRSTRLNLKKGDLWVHDGRVFHRGTPNGDAVPRDELCMGFSASWLYSGWCDAHEQGPLLNAEFIGGMSDHAKVALRRMTAGEPDPTGAGYSNAGNNPTDADVAAAGLAVAGYCSHVPSEQYHKMWAAAPLEGYDWRAEQQLLGNARL
jgi:hypothetical protein